MFFNLPLDPLEFRVVSLLSECVSSFSLDPPIFRGLKKLQLKDTKQRMVLQCAARGVSVYSPHTSCDNCEDGGMSTSFNALPLILTVFLHLTAY